MKYSFLAIAINSLLLWQTPAWADELSPAASKTSDFWEGMAERVNTEFESKSWKEMPDEVLIPANRIKWNRLAKAALNLPDWVEFSLSQRSRFESASHPWRNGQSNAVDSQIPLQSRVRLGFNHGPFWVMFEGQDSRTFDAEKKDFVGTTVVNKFDVLQLFGSMTFRNINDSGLRGDLHVGRMSMHIGSARLVGRNGYRNTTNAFDGGQITLGNDKDWRVKAFLNSPVQIEEAKLDGSRSKRMFWGLVFESTQLPYASGEAYYFGLNDQRNPDQSKNASFSTFGGRLYQSQANPEKFKADDFGKYDYELESAVQVGDKGANNFFAYMAHAEVGYTLNAPWYPRLAGEYDYASGTSNPNANATNHKFDRLFGTRRADMMETGLFGPFFRSNIESVGSRFTVQPRNDLKLMTKYHAWYLAEATDEFVGSNIGSAAALRDRTGSAGRFLGHDIELLASWRLKSNWTLEAGYERWFKSNYFNNPNIRKNLPQGGEKDTDYFFVSSELRF